MPKLTTFLENRAISALKIVKQLEQKKKKAKRNLKPKFLRRLVSARKEANMATQLAKDIAILAQWLKNDILSVTGPNFSSRLELLKFVAAELEAREIYCSHSENSRSKLNKTYKFSFHTSLGVL